MTNQAINQEQANEIIDRHFDGWDSASGAPAGFAVWACDVAAETIEQIQTGELDDITHEVICSIEQEDEGPTVDHGQVAAWIDENRAELLKRLTNMFL